MESFQRLNGFAYKTQGNEPLTVPQNNGSIPSSDENNGGAKIIPAYFNATASKLERMPKADTISFCGDNEATDEKNEKTEKPDDFPTVYTKPGVGSILGGVIAGSMVQGAVGNGPQLIVSTDVMKKMKKISNSISEEASSQVEKTIFDTIKESGLEAKGVGVIKATKENAGEIANIMEKELNKGLTKYLPKDIRKFLGDLFSSQMKNGENACYTTVSKKIIMPEKELGLAMFHELGHAMNANLSTFGSFLQKSRALNLLAIPITLIALWKTKKAPGEEPKNGLDKTTTFIKDNAGKLTFATFIPILLEEGLASIKGNALAKKALSPELAQKVAKSNLLGFSTYLLAATLSGLGIYLGTKVKDSIAHKKQVMPASDN